MKILLFHPVLLPPVDYGGVERVVLWLAKGLTQLGHEVTIAALEGSQLPRGVTLLPVSRRCKSDELLLKHLPNGTDVVHFMAPPSPRTLSSLNCPSVLTVHGNGKMGEIFPLNTVFLSRDHANRHGSQTFVYNGIDPTEYKFQHKKGRSFLFLSKTSWRVKNLTGTMALSQKAGIPLLIAGGSRPYLARFRAMLNPNFKWMGSVSGLEKMNLLASARALLFPVLWPEPFGLVIAEAWMSGTPVIANPRGSTREMVLPSVGYLPETEEQWMQAIDTIGKISPEACRSHAETHFHYLKMAENYESVYRKIIAGGKLNTQAPQSAGWELK